MRYFTRLVPRAVQFGCVPLIIQPAVLQPLEDTLPYDRFALRLEAEDIPSLHTRLASATPAQHAAMRAQLAEYAPAFSWALAGSSKPDSMAYEYVRYALCKRAGLATCEDIAPRRGY